jgi:hypothetical protein
MVVAPKGATNCLQDVKALIGFDSNGCNVETEDEHGIKYDPQGLGSSEKSNNYTVDKNIRPDIKLLVPWGEHGHLGFG